MGSWCKSLTPFSGVKVGWSFLAPFLSTSSPKGPLSTFIKTANPAWEKERKSVSQTYDFIIIDTGNDPNNSLEKKYKREHKVIFTEKPKWCCDSIYFRRLDHFQKHEIIHRSRFTSGTSFCDYYHLLLESWDLLFVNITLK